MAAARSLIWSLILVGVATAPRRATAQVGATSDIITGTVTGPDVIVSLDNGRGRSIEFRRVYDAVAS